jgi:hypothetical protein
MGRGRLVVLLDDQTAAPCRLLRACFDLRCTANWCLRVVSHGTLVCKDLTKMPISDENLDVAGEQDGAVVQTRSKPDLWWIASLILLAISLFGFGHILWNSYWAGQ